MLSNETLARISDDFMTGVGFGKQPYVVYRHFDAAHPHVHILSPTLREDGTLIPGQYVKMPGYRELIGRIDQHYGLEPYRGRPNEEHPKEDIPQKLIYGQSAIQPAIEHITGYILSQFEFRSLEAYHALLRLYNIKCIVSKKHSAVGYCSLDQEGKNKGYFFPAQVLRNKPTLERLEEKFRESTRGPRELTSATIENVLKSRPPDLSYFFRALRSSGIHTVIRHNDEGVIARMSYIDRVRSNVFTENELTQSCGARQILLYFGLTQAADQVGKEPMTLKDRSKASRRTAFRRFSVATDLPEHSPLAVLFQSLEQSRLLQREPSRQRTPERLPPF